MINGLPTHIKPYYQEEDIVIYHGDCRDILPHLPKVDLVLTSPPYDNLRTYGGHDFDYISTIDAIMPVIKEGGVCVWVVGDETINGSESGNSFRQVLYFMYKGINLFDTMIYKKNGPAYPSNDKYFRIFEYMFVLSNGRVKTFNPLEDRFNKWYGQKFSKIRSRRKKDGTVITTEWDKEQGGQYGKRFNIWEYNVGAGYSTKDEIAFQHPATFPEQLAADHIKSWSNEGDIVCDPLCGSGTTLKMAKILGRRAVGIEIEEKYCAIAVKRLGQGVLEI